MSRLKVGFFCRTADPGVLKQIEYYAQDLRILDELGYDVHVATSPATLRPADLYFGWSWNWGFAPMLAGKLLRRPIVLTGVFNAMAFGSRRAPSRTLHQIALRRASVNVFVSRFEQTNIAQTFRVNRPEYCPLTVDTSVYVPGSGERRPFLLSIAGAGLQNGTARRKCVPELIRAFALLRERGLEIRLCLVGQKGNDYFELAELACKLRVFGAIDFVGRVSVDEKIQLLQECALYLQPSRFEGFGLGVLEAMSCGTPVVTSPVGGIPEVVGNTAAFVDGTDPHAIARCVEALLFDDETRREMGVRGRERAKREFPYVRRRTYFARLFNDILANRERSLSV